MSSLILRDDGVESDKAGDDVDDGDEDGGYMVKATVKAKVTMTITTMRVKMGRDALTNYYRGHSVCCYRQRLY